MLASILFHVVAVSGMALVAWWLWMDEDRPHPAGTPAPRPLAYPPVSRRRRPAA
jgi:hypothetical protein